MLDPSSLNASVELNQALAERNVVLTAIPETALAMLVRETATLAIEPARIDYAGAISAISESSIGPEHADLFTHVVQLASSSVRSTLDFTRNVAMPHLRTVVEAHKQAMLAYATCPVPYDIRFQYQPEIYKLQAGMDFSDRWAQAPVANEPASFNFGAYAPEEIMKLATLTEDGGFNTHMEELLMDNKGEGLSVIAQVLRGEIGFKSVPAEFAMPLAIVLENIETPKEGVAASLTDYRLARTLLTNVSAKASLRVMERMSSNMQTSTLYARAYVPDASVIEVNGEVYKSMLEKELTTEVLIGNELLGRKYYGEQLLTAPVVEELKAVYERDKAIRQQAHVVNTREASRRAIMNVLREDHNRIADDNAFIVEGDSKEKSWSRLRGFVDKLLTTPEAGAEPAMIIAAALCATWYAHTDAARLLDIMMSIGKTQPNLPSDELATLATLQYIADWVASQIGAAIVDGMAAQ